jgi:Predicted transcriptional regulator containing an HTH domain and an uncharacterized domain shared with the mammalian protein Schlafen
MIVLDGRNDREKLDELLAAGEQTHLEYKAVLDLSQARDKLNLVKDVVTMSNRPGGGYILVGVDDAGTPCRTSGELDRKRFDGAAIGQSVRSYIDGQIEVHTQVHDLDDGHEVVVIRVESHRDGLPVPMAKIGQFRDDNGKDVVVFREGEVLIREGSANVPLRHTHWPELLTARDRRIREQAQENIQELVAQLVGQIRSQGGRVVAPLAAGMDEATFTDAVLSNLEAGSDIRLQQFLAQARNVAASSQSEPDQVTDILDRVTVLGAQAIFFGRDDEARAAVDTLHEVYMQVAAAGSGNTVSRLVEIITRAYVLGSLALRRRRWSLVRYVVHKPVELPPGGGYVYASWLRHGQVEGSRANLFPPGNGGLLISAARALAADHPAMRPDVPDEVVPPIEDLDHTDELLNALCQFDLAYCLTVAAEGKGQARGYPACAAFHQTRADPTYVTLATDGEARGELFTESDDALVAGAMVRVHDLAEKESWNYGGFWSDLPLPALKFVRDHLPDGDGSA